MAGRARRGLMRALLLALALLPGLAPAAPKAERWDRWDSHDPAATRVLDHTLWTRFLQRYLVAGPDGVNRLRYGQVSGDDMGYLRVYIDQLLRVDVSALRREEQRAYWINLYNAFTVKLVLERYPLNSILQIGISPGWFAKGPWGARNLKVEDETLSLDDIEHRILRPLWNDPRVHYALNCASLGCPNLAREAYTASNTEVLLEAGARAYVNHPRGAHMGEDGRLTVSSLYEWFKPDFGGTDARVIAHLRRYAEPALAAQLAQVQRISADRYDWALNDAR